MERFELPEDLVAVQTLPPVSACNLSREARVLIYWVFTTRHASEGSSCRVSTTIPLVNNPQLALCGSLNQRTASACGLLPSTICRRAKIAAKMFVEKVGRARISMITFDRITGESVRPENCEPPRRSAWVPCSSHRLRKCFAVVLLVMFNPAGSAADLLSLTETLQQHCAKCHSEESPEGGLDLSLLSRDLSDASVRSQWIHVYDRVDKKEMPPKGDELPEAIRETVLKTLGSELHKADLKDVLMHGRGPMRRLNRDEFEQNLRDVLHLPDLSIRDILPEDRTGAHFHKTTAVLDFSRVQLMAFLDAAESALIQAMASGLEPPPSTQFRAMATQMFQEAETFGNKEAMFYAKDGHMLPLSGGQLAELRGSGQHDPTVEMALFRSAHWPYYGYPNGFLAQLPGRYKVRFSARSVLQLPGFMLQPGAKSVPMTFRARKPSGPDVSGDVRATGGMMDIAPEVAVYETTILLKPGETFEYSLLGLPVPLARNVNNGPPEYRYPPFPEGGQPGIAFQWIEVDGPVSPSLVAPPQWPAVSHHVLFDNLAIRPATRGTGLPVDVNSEDPAADAHRLLRRFVALAARQPVSDEELVPFDQLIQVRLQDGDSFAAAMLATYKAFLCSRHFLFVSEPRNNDAYAVASRLSHFLTNTRPDKQLMEMAAIGQLSDPAVLRAETNRLIADERFDAFVRSFTDDWLNLRALYRDEPDVRLYPEYRFDNYLVESMEQETRTTFAAMVRENLPATTLVDADFVFANDRLASHYGLAPVLGSKVRKVELPEGSPYGGLLTQASILKVTANGTATSPVVRGAWIMDRLIGNPPPAPPASVPAVEPDIRGATTIRELLDLHTKSESCAACHAKFDPVGLALESFDILGAERARYRSLGLGESITGIDRAGHDFTYTLGVAVDSSGTLPDGRRFHDVRELKKLLRNDVRQLARNLLNQFTVYATGTPVRFSDRREIELLLDQCGDNGYPVGDLLHALVQSRLFVGEQHRE